MVAIWCCLTALAASPYALAPAPDLAASVGAGLLLGLNLFPAPPRCGLGCDPARVPGLDRLALGRDAPAAGPLSDGLVGGLVLLPYALDALDADDGFWTDSAVMAQAMTLSMGIDSVAKLAVRRPRPLVYDPARPEAERTSADAGRSFYSGHTAAAFTALGAYATTYALRHPHDPKRWLIWGVGGALATTAGVLRVQAGAHFPSDVLTGAAMGLGVGIGVPLLHRRR